MVQQIPLPLVWPHHATFDYFYTTPNNAIVLTHLKKMLLGQGERYIYLYSPAGGVGLTHLLKAACAFIQVQGEQAAYGSLKSVQAKTPSMGTNLLPNKISKDSAFKLICWDDIDCAAQNTFWEEWLFHQYNQLSMENTYLLIAGHTPPAQIAWHLADLKSRLTAGLMLTVYPLNDEEKMAALQQNAQLRGLTLTYEVGQYLLRHYPRDMHALFKTLDQLDHYSLAEQRRLSIPFLKKVLAQ